MELLVRKIPADEVEHEITQRDQFNTEEFALPETLVRETLQNTQDGKDDSQTGPARSVMRFVTPGTTHASYWSTLLSPLFPHLEACDIATGSLDFEKMRLLVIEDYGTTGLLGAFDRKDDRNFSDFWRRFGKSHKGGTRLGRHGLGKLVYSSVSLVRTFFGLTVRSDDPARERLLMGQSTVATHTISSEEYAPHIFFANPGLGGFQLPERDPDRVAEFASAASLQRNSEPGLSVVIPFVHGEITAEELLPFVIRNYYFPILTGRLVVQLDQYVIDEANFDELAKTHGGEELADGRLISFIREVRGQFASAPGVTVENWAKDMKPALGEAQLAQLREKYFQGELIAVRAAIVLTEKDGKIRPTHVDLYLRAAPAGVRGHALFVRGDLTVPGEARSFRGRDAFAVLLARDPPVAGFLGDAENPAHTKWIGSAEKVKARWKSAGVGVASIRNSPSLLYEAIAGAIEKVDNEALLKFFYVKKTVPKAGKKKGKPPLPPDIVPTPKRYRLTKVAGGFRISGESSATVPYTLRVAAAYDVARGNPLAKHSAYDFDFGNAGASGEPTIQTSGASFAVRSARDLEIDVDDPAFEVIVTGFDSDRDIFVRVDVEGS